MHATATPSGTIGPRIAAGREAEVFAWNDDTVLRLFRTARSAATLAREAEAMTAARFVGPIVPEARGTVEIDGRQGLLIERIDGPDLLAEMERKPWTVWSVGHTLGQLQSHLHGAVAPYSIPSVKERLHRLISSSNVVPEAVASTALQTLADLPDGDRLLHGDLHPANILLGRSGPVIVDWPNATRGDPLADVARTLVICQTGRFQGDDLRSRFAATIGRRLLITSYRRAYGIHRPIDRRQLNAWITVCLVDRLAENIPEEREILLRRLRLSDDQLAERSIHR